MKKLTVIFVLTVFSFTGCVTSYHMQVFSNDVETLPTTVTEIVNPANNTDTPYQKIEYEGLFKADSYEKAMEQAKKAGFTKVLSIEYGTNLFFGIIGTRWVTIRCAKGTDETEIQNEPEAAPSENDQL